MKNKRNKRNNRREAASAKRGHSLRPSGPVAAFQLRMAMHDMTMATQEDADLLTASPLMSIERLSIGTLNDEGFIDLNEANIAAFELARRLHEFASEDSKAAIAPASEVFEAAAEALAGIGERKASIGRYVAKGDELSAIKEAVSLYAMLIPLSEKGHITTALVNAAGLVTDKLMAIHAEQQAAA